MHAWNKSVDQDLAEHCIKLVLTLYIILCIYGLIQEVLQFLLCVQVHSYDKEPNTEVTGRITCLLVYELTDVLCFHCAQCTLSNSNNIVQTFE